MNSIDPVVVTLNANEPYQLCGCCRCPDPKHATRCPHPHAIQPKRKELVWLCRCGKSEQRPYCDGRHNPRHDMSLAQAIKAVFEDVRQAWRKRKDDATKNN